MVPLLAQINEECCDDIATILSHHAIPSDEEDSSIEQLNSDQLGNFYFLLVAICHQTQDLQGYISGTFWRGWDYLRLRLLKSVCEDEELLTLKEWREMTVERLAGHLRDAKLGDTLSGLEGRVNLIQDLGLQMEYLKAKTVNELFLASSGKLSGDAPGMLSTLNRFKAYADPVRKKSFFFLGLMQNSGLWQYLDEMELGAPVDYHEVRGHLRMGTVRICKELESKLIQRIPVSESEDVAIRNAVRQAISRISLAINYSPMRVHYLFWNLFRNVCLRENPKCFSVDEQNRVPARYQQFIKSGRCPFAGKCESAGKPNLLIEHSFNTDWY
jgi:hypothetical protein